MTHKAFSSCPKTYQLYGYIPIKMLWTVYSIAYSTNFWFVTGFDNTNGEVTCDTSGILAADKSWMKPSVTTYLKIVITSTDSEVTEKRVVEDLFTVFISESGGVPTCKDNEIQFDPTGSRVYDYGYGSTSE